MEKTLTKAIKTICCSLTGVLTISGTPQQVYAENASLPYWKDIQTVSVNREAPRSAFMTYADKNQALTGKYENSPYYELLNGTWKFYYTDSYLNLPADITSPEVSTEDGTILRCRETGKCKDSVRLFIRITDMSFNLVILNLPCCRRRIQWECTGVILPYLQNGRTVIFTFTLPEQNQDAMCI